MSTEQVPPRPFPISDVPWTEWSEAPRFSLRYRHLSRAALGDNYRVGVAIEELLPGSQSSPAHYHIFEEEHVFILEGALTVRIGAESFPMKAGDYVCFPAGWKAGHCLVNDSGAVCRYVIVGERDPNEVVVYTDTGKVLVRSLGRRALFDLAATRTYWEGEDIGLPDGRLPGDDVAAVDALEPATPVPPISSNELAWDETLHAPGFVDRNKHLTYAALKRPDYHVGILIEGPPPGARMAPRHYHLFEEEHALILEGEVTLLFGDERHEMRPGDYVCFPAGQRIGHSFLNSGSGPCAWLMIGEKNPGDVAVMPDSNKMEVRAFRPERSIFDMSAVRHYLDGEPAG